MPFELPSQTFRCDDYDDYPSGALRADPSIDCGSAKHKSFRGYGAC
jgi:hypothetical protein